MIKKELTKPISSSLPSIATDYAVTVRNCSSQDVQLQCKEHSSLAELSTTETTCHNMPSTVNTFKNHLDKLRKDIGVIVLK